MPRYQKLKEKALILGNRAYGTVKGIAHVRAQNAYYIFRLKANSFTLYTAEDEKFDLAKCLENEWAPGKLLEFQLYYKNGKDYCPVCVCALEKTAEQIAKSERHIRKSSNRKKRGKLSPMQTVFNRVVVVCTSLPDSIPSEKIFQLYRIRWQIELTFKRMKSIFDIGKFICFKEQSVFAWFYGKLLLSSLCEILVNRGSLCWKISPVLTCCTDAVYGGSSVLSAVTFCILSALHFDLFFDRLPHLIPACASSKRNRILALSPSISVNCTHMPLRGRS